MCISLRCCRPTSVTRVAESESRVRLSIFERWARPSSPTSVISRINSRSRESSLSGSSPLLVSAQSVASSTSRYSNCPSNLNPSSPTRALYFMKSSVVSALSFEIIRREIARTPIPRFPSCSATANTSGSGGVFFSCSLLDIKMGFLIFIPQMLIGEQKKNGGRNRIRTCEGIASRFTVCPV